MEGMSRGVMKNGTEVERTATAAAWVRKPKRLNLSSPWEARATPVEIMRMMTANFLFGSCRRNVHEMRRMATGVNA